jgi:hypothetical protein
LAGAVAAAVRLADGIELDLVLALERVRMAGWRPVLLTTLWTLSIGACLRTGLHFAGTCAKLPSNRKARREHKEPHSQLA